MSNRPSDPVHTSDEPTRQSAQATLVWSTIGHAESPVWDAERRLVFFAEPNDKHGQEFGLLHAFCVDDESRTTWTIPETIRSIGLCTSGNLILSQRRKLVRFNPDDGSIEDFSREIDAPAINRLNDGKPGPDGRFWIGFNDGRKYLPDWKEGMPRDPNGCLLRFDASGEYEEKATGFLVFNGLAFTPDGKTMYNTGRVTGSAIRHVDAWDFDPATESIANRRLLAELTTTIGRPDGGAADAEGCYWSAGVSAGCLNRLSPKGELLLSIRLPFPSPTMPCFADEWLFVTSLARTTNDPLNVDPTKGFSYNAAGLSRMRSPVPGADVPRFVDS